MRQSVIWALVAYEFLVFVPSDAAADDLGTYKVTDLGTLGGDSSYAYRLNAAAHVVGDAALSGNAPAHAYVYRDGAMIDLGTLGHKYSVAYDINVWGQVVGTSYEDGIYRAKNSRHRKAS